MLPTSRRTRKRPPTSHRWGALVEKPSHELTAEEDNDVANWNAIAADPHSRSFSVRRRDHHYLSTIFFLIYYFTLPVLVGWLPK